MAKQRVSQNYLTKKVTVTGYCAVNKPLTKFNKSGTYNCNVFLTAEDGKDILKAAQNVLKEQHKQYGSGTVKAEITCIKPYVIVDEEGNETPDVEGRYLLKTKANAWIEAGKPTNKIAVYDSKNKLLSDINIGAGSIVKLFFTFEGYTVAGKTGVSAVLKAVQLIKLSERDITSAEEAGFTIEEEGFCADDEIDMSGEESPQDELDF